MNPDASLEARELLRYLYEVRGRFMLSGQHNQMHHMSDPSEQVAAITGRYPLVWGGEWGFSDERHNIDNVKFRPRLLEQIREQHAKGRIAVLSYHQASPTVGEPCSFQGGVVVRLTDDEWRAILTEGTALHQIWADHVDRLAEALAELGRESIPIVFRPYHEMNGAWFWWGGDPDRFKALWAMVYDRFTRHHRLNNLLWAWTCDRPWPNVADFYPGPETVDILGADIYPTQGQDDVYPQEWFDRMQEIAAGKPVALSENAVLPNPDDFERQPWLWFMAWDNMVFHANANERIREVYSHPLVRSDRR